MSRFSVKVCVIFPNDAVLHVALGFMKFGWLKTLNISARNWTLKRSLTGMFLNTEKSAFTNPGPRRIFLPASPNVKGVGSAKALESMQWTRWPEPQPLESDEMSIA